MLLLSSMLHKDFGIGSNFLYKNLGTQTKNICFNIFQENLNS